MDQRRALVTQYLEKQKAKLSWLIQAASLSLNAWYHRSNQTDKPTAEATIVKEIEAVLIVSPYYGYRRVTAELKRQDKVYNHKRILRIMGENLLIQPRKRRTAPQTTNSNHNFVVYTNKIKYLETLTPSTV